MRKLFFIIVTAIGMMQIPMQSINAQNMKKEEGTSKHQRISGRKSEYRIRTIFHG